MSQFKVGDVVHYRPSQYHCREGVAVAACRASGVVLLDTFWGSYGDRHLLDDAEAATAELQFNLDDYDEIDHYARTSDTWAKYAPADREVITSQHGLQRRWFVRKGAAESWPQRIENARQTLAKAELSAASAQRSVEWLREELARIESAAKAAGTPVEASQQETTK